MEFLITDITENELLPIVIKINYRFHFLKNSENLKDHLSNRQQKIFK